jgi:Flp pilus assembly CpaF family ATPase
MANSVRCRTKSRRKKYRCGTEAPSRPDFLAPDFACTHKPLRVREEALGILRLGPIEFLLKEPVVTEVMVNGPDDVYVARKGRLERVAARLRRSRFDA